MIELGKLNTLKMISKTEFGIYLGSKAQKVLLPKKQVPEGINFGDSLEVFVYKDSSDRLIATVNRPKVMLSQVALLKCKEVGKIGAFMDWGLEKDLFMPFKEQTVKVKAGHDYLVSVYVDKSDRLCATMKIYDYLENQSPYEKDDRVTGYVYDINPEFGAFVAVDNRYNAMIGRSELFSTVKVGENISARVTNVREDGKLDLSIKQKAYIQMDTDAQLVMQAIEEFGGVLPFSDKASPEVIKREMNMSKNQFKRAVGRLLKEDKIIIGEKSIKKK